MSTITDQIAALEEAIATGALEVEYRSGDTTRRVKYRTLAEMERVLATLKAGASSVKPVSRTVGVVVVR